MALRDRVGVGVSSLGSAPAPPPTANDGVPPPSRCLAGFWLLGCLNNASYVIMIAGANDISPEAVGSVYLCAILPALAVKLAAPHFFHRVSYGRRVQAAALLMAASFTLVGLGRGQGAQLAGVALASL